MIRITEFSFTPFHFKILDLLQKMPLIRDNQLCRELCTHRSTVYDYLRDLKLLKLIKSYSEPVAKQQPPKRGRPKVKWVLNRHVYDDYAVFFERERQKLNENPLKLKSKKANHLLDQKSAERIKRKLSSHETRLLNGMIMIFNMG